jgi:hypothetical protein
MQLTFHMWQQNHVKENNNKDLKNIW